MSSLSIHLRCRGWKYRYLITNIMTSFSTHLRCHNIVCQVWPSHGFFVYILTYNSQPLDLQLLTSWPTTLELSTYNAKPFATSFPLLCHGLIIFLDDSCPLGLSVCICKKLQIMELCLLIRFEIEKAREVELEVERGGEFEADRVRLQHGQYHEVVSLSHHTIGWKYTDLLSNIMASCPMHLISYRMEVQSPTHHHVSRLSDV